MLFLIPFALVLVSSLALGRAVYPRAGAGDRVMAGAVLAATACTVAVRVLGAIGVLTALGAWVALAALVIASIGLGRRAVLQGGPRSPEPSEEEWSGWKAAVLPCVIGAAAVSAAAAAAAWLPIWQWDSLGYHLPFVNYAIQAGSFDGVPSELPYLGTYPHGVELLFLGLRLFLPDDRLVDLGQIPFALAASAAIAALARRAGAARPAAVAAGALWLALPAVFLQMPSNYVDIAVAAYLLFAIYFILAPPDPPAILLAGASVGLFLGAKPTAPLAAAILLGLLVWRARQAGRAAAAAAAGAALLALVIGGESYVVNLVRHHNPVWPVAVSLGPIHFPGPHPVDELLAAGAGAPRLKGPLPWRLVRAWTTLISPLPMFDMRIGGFGPAFALAFLPAAVFTLVKSSRPGATLVAAAATLAIPDPSIARYTLAFPGLCMALAAAAVGLLSRNGRFVALSAASVLSAIGLADSFSGLTGGEGSILRYASMTSDERERALGPEEHTDRWVDLRSALRPGEAIAYDASFELAYLLWRSDLQNRVIWLSNDLDAEAIEHLLQSDNVKVLVAGDELASGALARSDPDRFQPLFHCVTDACTVYRVVETKQQAR